MTTTNISMYLKLQNLFILLNNSPLFSVICKLACVTAGLCGDAVKHCFSFKWVVIYQLYHVLLSGPGCTGQNLDKGHQSLAGLRPWADRRHPTT